MADFTFEKLTENIKICISAEHRFGTDAFLLADFANPRQKDLVCDLGTGCGIIPLVMSRKLPLRKFTPWIFSLRRLNSLNWGLKIPSWRTKLFPSAPI